MPQRIKAIWSDNPGHMEEQINDFLKEIKYCHNAIQFTQSYSPEGINAQGTTYTAWIEYTVEEGGAK